MKLSESVTKTVTKIACITVELKMSAYLNDLELLIDKGFDHLSNPEFKPKTNA